MSRISFGGGIGEKSVASKEEGMIKCTTVWD